MISQLPAFARARIVVEPRGCWRWTGRVRPDGYGAWGNYLAHRRIYQLLVEPLPPWSTDPTSLELDHLCRNRRCVNPDHLEVVTRRVNVLRGASVVAENARHSHCPQGHELTGANLVRSRLPQRQCRECHLEHERRWRESRRATAKAS